MSKPLISVIVPVYDNEKYVSECLSSIFNQDYPNLEVIVVNDGSTDNSLTVLKKLKADHEFILIDKKNGGVSSARNAGLIKASGEYIFFVDSDDTLHKSCLSYYYSLIANNKADAAVVPMPVKYTSDEQLPEPAESFSPYVITGNEAAEMMLYYKIVISSWGKLFSKKVIDDNTIRFDESLAYGEGFHFSINFFTHAQSVAIGSKKVYQYRLDNANSAMTKYKDRLVDDSLISQQKIRNLIADKGKSLTKASDYAIFHTKFDCLNTIIGSGANKPDLKKSLSRDIRAFAPKTLFMQIPLKDKLKGCLSIASPVLSSKLINKGRKRKFTS